jgi:hypothetical protein
LTVAGGACHDAVAAPDEAVSMPDWFHLSHLFTFAVLLLFLAGAAVTLPQVTRELAGVRRLAWVALVAIVAADVIMVRLWVPHAAWQPSEHGFAVVTQIERGLKGLERLELAMNHGHAWSIVLGGLQRVVLRGSLTVFEINHALSVAGLVVAFVLARVLSGTDRVAVLATLALAALPMRLRLSATETMNACLELFLLSAFLYLALWSRTGRRSLLPVGLAALALAMQCRLEFVLFGPVLAGALVLAVTRGRLAARLREAGTWLSLAGFLAAVAPWLIYLALSGDPRLRRTPDILPRLLGPLIESPGAFTPWTDPSWTPVAFGALVLAGQWFLARRDLPLLVFADVFCLALALLYSHQADSVSTRVRTAATCAFPFALVAGYGMDGLLALAQRVPRLPRAAGAAAAVALAGSIAASFVPCVPALTRVHACQQEYAFLEEVERILPSPATLVTLTATDHGSAFVVTRHLEEGFADTGSQRTVKSVAQALDAPDALLAVPGPDAYWYRGLPCRIPPVRPDTIPWRPLVEGPDWVHPACLAMEKRFALVPVAEREVEGGGEHLGLSPERMVTERARIGLYRIVGVRAAPPGG